MFREPCKAICTLLLLPIVMCSPTLGLAYSRNSLHLRQRLLHLAQRLHEQAPQLKALGQLRHTQTQPCRPKLLHMATRLGVI